MSDEQAITRHEGYLRLDPNNAALLVTLGDLYHRAGKLTEAISCYERCIAVAPEHTFAKSRLANVYITQLRFEDAEHALRELIDPAKPDPALLHNLGLALYYQERWPEALEHFARARATGLSDGRNALYEAYSMHQLGRVDEAAALCKEVLASTQDDVLDGYLCVLEMDRGNMTQAHARAQSMLQRNPKNPDAALVTGMWSMERQEMEAAEHQIDLVLSAEPESARGLFAKGLIHLHRSQPTRAIEYIEAALKRTPNHVGTLVTLAWAHFAAKDILTAEHTFRRAIAADGTFGEAHGGLAVTLVFQNKREEARREAHIARRLNPDGLGALWARAALMALDGKREMGEAMLAAALERPFLPDGATLMSHIQKYLRTQAARGAGVPKHLH